MVTSKHLEKPHVLAVSFLLIIVAAYVQAGQSADLCQQKISQSRYVLTD